LLAVSDFADDSLDIVFLDALQTYNGVLWDTISYFPKLRIGGIISFPYNTMFPGAALAADDFSFCFNSTLMPMYRNETFMFAHKPAGGMPALNKIGTAATRCSPFISHLIANTNEQL